MEAYELCVPLTSPSDTSTQIQALRYKPSTPDYWLMRTYTRLSPELSRISGHIDGKYVIYGMCVSVHVCTSTS